MSTYTQTAYGGPRAGAPGAIVDGTLSEIVTAGALEVVYPGRFAVLVRSADKDRPDVRNARANAMNIVFSANLTTGSFQGSLKTTAFNGAEVTTAISTAYTVSHAATITAILADFNAIAGITATATDPANNRSIRLVAAKGVQLSEAIAFAVSGGSPTVTTNVSTTDKFNCVVGQDPITEQTAEGTTAYVPGDRVPLVRVGAVYMDAETAMSDGDPVAARLTQAAGANQKYGSLRNSVGTVAVAALVENAIVYIPTSAADTTAAIEVNFKGQS